MALLLYDNPASGNALKVRFLLRELGLEWATREVPLARPRPDWYLAVNPLGGVPTLDDDGFVLTESNTILRYLAQREGRTDLYPDEPRERARVDEFLDRWSLTFRPALKTFRGRVGDRGGRRRDRDARRGRDRADPPGARGARRRPAAFALGRSRSPTLRPRLRSSDPGRQRARPGLFPAIERLAGDGARPGRRSSGRASRRAHTAVALNPRLQEFAGVSTRMRGDMVFATDDPLSTDAQPAPHPSELAAAHGRGCRARACRS